MRFVELTAKIKETGGKVSPLIIEPGIIGFAFGKPGAFSTHVDFGGDLGIRSVHETWIKDIAGSIDELIEYLERRKNARRDITQNHSHD